MSEAPRDPMRAAQANMRPSPSSSASIGRCEVGEAAGGQYALTLDGRGARTPGRNPLAAKSRALMLKVAAEWERQRETIEPADMPLTRLAQLGDRRRLATMAETRAEVRQICRLRSPLLPRRGAGSAGRTPAARLRSGARLGGGDARRALSSRRRASCMSSSRRRRSPRSARRSRISTIRSRSPRSAQ